MEIYDGTGTGKRAKVDSENRLLVAAVVAGQQHEVSHEKSLAFQVSAEKAISTTEQSILNVTNDSSDVLIITFIRLEIASAAAASDAAYFKIKSGGAYVSGGTAITPSNMNVGSTVPALVSIYDNSGATIVEDTNYSQIDKTFLNDNSYNKHGALILKKGASISISHTGSTIAGTCYCRVSFYFDNPA